MLMFYHVNILACMQDVCVPVYTCLAIGINLLDLESYNLCMYIIMYMYTCSTVYFCCYSCVIAMQGSCGRCV